MRSSLCLLLILSAPAIVSAQDAHDHGPTVAGRMPAEIIERAVPLRDGIGKVSHPTSAKSREAQAYYEQGLAYLHSYQFLEAARSFNQAMRLEKDFALAWVGLSRAYSGLDDAEMARDALKHAQAITTVSPDEARWIAVRERQLESMDAPGDREKFRGYIAALDLALEHNPNDAELWTQRGNAEEPLGARGRGQRGTASSIAFYERAIAVAPGHFGAHHYLIHTYEQTGHFDKALVHGKVYADAASTVPHALHMYAHDLMKLGRMPEAIEVFGRARTLEHEYYERERIAREFDWHHTHNLGLLALSHRHEGHMDEAERILRDGASVAQPTPLRKGYNQAVLLDLLYARGAHEEVLKEARILTTIAHPTVTTLGHALAARSLMALNRAADAAAHIAPLETPLSEAANFAAYANMQASLALGEYELRTGKTSEGAARLRDVLTRARSQRSPDGWIEGLFMLEAVFNVARATGNWDLAADASRRLLEHDKTYAGAKEAARVIDARRRP